MEIMEFEKLQQIIAEVLNIDSQEKVSLHRDTFF